MLFRPGGWLQAPACGPGWPIAVPLSLHNDWSRLDTLLANQCSLFPWQLGLVQGVAWDPGRLIRVNSGRLEKLWEKEVLFCS